MNRSLRYTAFAAGLLALAWVGAGYIPGNPLALTLVLLIGAFFVAGALELRRFQEATDSLAGAVNAAKDTPPDLTAWLAPLHPSLQHAVRLRVEGERAALPGPALTPYLAGLLVLLGMLGTFLGMVATLKGTGLALESANDVDAIRASIVAPVKGLGLAFGTSVAGVAASAMLGLMSALARRERQHVAQQLDARIATTLRGFSQVHRREESLRLMQVQAQVMPALVTQLQALVAQVERQGQALHERMLASQAQFQGEAQRAYSDLAQSVDRSLKSMLAESARMAGSAIEPAVKATMAGLAHEASTLRHTIADAVQQQLDGLDSRLDGMSARLADQWQGALASQQRHIESVTQGLHGGLDRFAQTFEQHAAAMLHKVAEAHAAWDAAAAAREQERMSAFHDSMAGMASTLRNQAEDNGSAMARRQEQICTTLEQTAQAITAQTQAHAQATIGEISRLVQVASQAPRAAAEVIGELRQALSDSLARDNQALDERNRLMSTLGSLLDAVNHASTEQRACIDALVSSTTGVLDRVGQRFAETVQAESRHLETVAAQVTGSAAEVASLGEGFNMAVQIFSQASEKLMQQLQRIEAALGQSMARSDEQLAYYVAQARELIDLTLGSQKQIVEDLQQLAGNTAAANAPSEAAAA